MVDVAGIGFNAQDFFFEIQGVCRNQSGRRIGCGVGFDNFTGNPTFNSSGSPNELVPDPDIAGTGIVVAIVIQTFLIFLLATVHVLDGPSLLHRDYIGISTFSDASTLLALAYITNFILTGKCTMSTYHYYIALDSILMACSTLVLTFTTSRYRYFKIVANYLRYFFMFAIFVLLGVLLGYQFLKHFNTDFPEWNPPDTKDRNASSLVLPASCFLDPDLIKGENPYAPKRRDKLSEDELQRIGLPVKNHAIPQLSIYIVLAVFLVVGTLLPCLCCFRTRPRQPLQERNARIYRRCFWGLLLFVCLATDIFCVWHIFKLKNWAKYSGNLGDDKSEDGFSSVGQLLPLFGLATWLLLWLQSYDFGRDADDDEGRARPRRWRGRHRFASRPKGV